MPRKPRFYLPEVPVHIVHRGHNRDPVFSDGADFSAYLGWLTEASIEHGCAIHAYVLMNNHVHFLVTPSDQTSIGRMIQQVNRHFGPYMRYEYGSTGSLWEGRYKASLVQDEVYLLTCMRYIELNPVRANMVKSPAHYRWSSYRANAQGKSDSLVTPHMQYLSLGRTVASRLEAYKALFVSHFDQGELDMINRAWQTGMPLGNDYFKEKIEKKLNVKLGHAKQGRPRKG